MIDKSVFIQQIREGRAAFDLALQALPAERLEQPIAPGGMTPKEIAYHLAWHERQMVDVLRARALVGSPWWELPLIEIICP